MGATAFQRMRRQQELKKQVGDDEVFKFLLSNDIDQVPKLETVDVDELTFPEDMKKSKRKELKKKIKASKSEDKTEEKEEAEEPENEEETAEDSLLDDMTNGEVAEHVAGIDDVEELEGLLEVEKANKDRKGAKEAIEDRIADLTEEG